MHTIKVISSACKVKGQGVGSCHEEQVSLIRNGLRGRFNVITRDSRHAQDESWASARMRTLGRRSADINHYHTIDPAHFVSNMLKSQRTVSVCYVHFLPETVQDSLRMPSTIRKLFNAYLMAFYKSMDYLVAVNPAFVAKLEAYGVDPSRIAYIPNTVSCEGFKPLPGNEAQAERSRLGLRPGKFVALGVGQLQTRKGVDDFVAVARSMPDVEFVWAGGFSFGRLTDGYERIRELVSNPPPNARFLGIVERSEMNALYNASDALFLPSHSELFPMTILEAMCCGKPLVLRDIDEYRPILSGSYIACRGIAGFEAAIARLRDDDAYRKEWGGRARTRYASYDSKRALEMWDSFYTQIIEARDNQRRRSRRVRAFARP